MKKKKVIRILIILFIVVLLMDLAFFLFNKTDKLKGNWDIDGYTEYVFDGKGNGKLVVPLTEYEFKYTVEKDVLSIDFKNEQSVDAEYKFSIKDDTLEIENVKDDSMHFKLKRKR